MPVFDVELVGKIGSMALIRREDNDIDYNIFSRLGAELKPGYIWVSSGATEIGRLDYMSRNDGRELLGEADDIKTDYAAQGQAILMQNYRTYIKPQYSVRQVLVEHHHLNDPQKREHIRQLLLRCTAQNAIPIINYNDAASAEENRKMELMNLRRVRGDVAECIDNDETAAVIAGLVKARLLVILTSVDGIYANADDPGTLIREVTGTDADEVIHTVRRLQQACVGSSRPGSNGARAKLEYIINPVINGTKVIIGHARHRLSDLIEGRVDRTVIGIKG